MPTTDATGVTGITGEGAASRTPGFACEAHDLKRILNHIADQIADADRRHSDALMQMHERLGVMGAATRQLKDQVPEEVSPAIQRIAGSMAELSERFAEAGEPTAMAAAVPAATQQAAQEPAPALRSALAGDTLGTFTRRDDGARGAGKPHVDPFDVVDFEAGPGESDHWDHASAEALTQLYESGEARLAALGQQGRPAPEAAGAPSPAHAQAYAAVEPARAVAVAATAAAEMPREKPAPLPVDLSIDIPPAAAPSAEPVARAEGGASVTGASTHASPAQPATLLSETVAAIAEASATAAAAAAAAAANAAVAEVNSERARQMSEERGWLQQRLDEVDAALANTSAASARAVAAERTWLELRLGEVNAAIAAASAARASAIEEERSWLEQRLDEVGAKLEQSVAGLKPGGTVAELDARFARIEASLDKVVASADTRARTVEDDRSWLEQRLVDVGLKLEQSLAGLKSDATVAELDVRFARLETSLGKVMSDAATRADVASLKTIENQVEDLTAQLDTVQTHFSRLDTIELELRALAERISEERLAQLFDRTPRSGPADGEAAADAIANRVAERLPPIEQALKALADRVSTEKIAALIGKAQQPPADPGAIARLVAEQLSGQITRPAGADDADRIEELRGLIHAFISEQRHGEEQTTTMLDTMQQAMIRLLDRMDVIESQRYAEPQPPAAAEAPHPIAAGRAVASADYEPAPETRAEPGRRRIDAVPVEVEDVRPAAAPQPAAKESAYREPAAEAPVQEPAKPLSREEFVASARRAARQAAAAQPEPAEAVEEPVARPARAKSAQGGSRALSRVSIALLCIIAVGAGFTLVKNTVLAPKPSVGVQAPATGAAPRGPDKRAMNLDDADIIIEDETKGGRGGPAAPAGREPGRPGPSKSSLPGDGLSPPLRGEGADIARALDGGAGIAMPSTGGVGATAGGLPVGSSEFVRQHIAAASGSERGGPTAPVTPAALPRDGKGGPAAGPNAKAVNEMPPLTIGPNSLRTAAAKGDPSAEFEIGARFAEGKGVPQDLRQAVVWYQRAAAQGFAPAQYRLASMYERGLGVKTDTARAKIWYQRAAEQGLVKAMHNLAVISAGRDNGTPDYETAAKWFTAAAEHGLTDSQFNLAIMRDSGLGVERDAKQAYKWFSLAARAGDEEAARRRESIKAKLSPDEVRDLEAELGNWRAKSSDTGINDARVAGEAWKQRTR